MAIIDPKELVKELGRTRQFQKLIEANKGEYLEPLHTARLKRLLEEKLARKDEFLKNVNEYLNTVDSMDAKVDPVYSELEYDIPYQKQASKAHRLSESADDLDQLFNQLLDESDTSAVDDFDTALLESELNSEFGSGLDDFDSLFGESDSITSSFDSLDDNELFSELLSEANQIVDELLAESGYDYDSDYDELDQLLDETLTEFELAAGDDYLLDESYDDDDYLFDESLYDDFEFDQILDEALDVVSRLTEHLVEQQTNSNDPMNIFDETTYLDEALFTYEDNDFVDPYDSVGGVTSSDFFNLTASDSAGWLDHDIPELLAPLHELSESFVNDFGFEDDDDEIGYAEDDYWTTHIAESDYDYLNEDIVINLYVVDREGGYGYGRFGAGYGKQPAPVVVVEEDEPEDDEYDSYYAPSASVDANDYDVYEESLINDEFDLFDESEFDSLIDDDFDLLTAADDDESIDDNDMQADEDEQLSDEDEDDELGDDNDFDTDDVDLSDDSLGEDTDEFEDRDHDGIPDKDEPHGELPEDFEGDHEQAMKEYGDKQDETEIEVKEGDEEIEIKFEED